MQPHRLLLATAFAVGITLAAPTPAHAAKPGKAGKGEQRVAARMLARFDRNDDQTLDATEAERVRNAFETLKALDKDNDGQLSDSEISAAKIGKKAGPGRKRKLK